MSDLTEKKEPRKREKHPDRVYLSGLALETLSAWVSQVHEALPGVKVTKTDLVNWRLRSESKNLSEKNLREIESLFFNPVKFAKWAAREVETAHARGELKTLRDILESRSKPRVKRPRSPSKLSKAQDSHESSDLEKSPKE